MLLSENNLQCVRMVSNGEPHPGCVCRDGYQGDHCEIRTDPFASVQGPDPGSGGGGNEGLGTALFSLLIVTVAATLGIIGTIVYRSRKSDGGGGAVVFKGEGMKVPSPKKGKKSKVNVDDLDPDGSATLGGPTGGDLELSESRPEPEGEKAGEENFKIDDDEEEEGGGKASDVEPSAQEIV